MIDRRKLLVGVVGAFFALFAAPLTALAQPMVRVYRVGLLTTTTPVATWRNLPAFQAFTQRAATSYSSIGLRKGSGSACQTLRPSLPILKLM